MQRLLLALCLALAACGSPSRSAPAPSPPPPAPPPPQCQTDDDCVLYEHDGRCDARPGHAAPTVTTIPPIGDPTAPCYAHGPRCEPTTHTCVAVAYPIS